MSQIPDSMLLADINTLRGDGYSNQQIIDAVNFVPPTPVAAFQRGVNAGYKSGSIEDKA
jgi:hypothetical protein